MKFEIYSYGLNNYGGYSDHNYYIELNINGISDDEEHAKYLDLTLQEYRNILMKCGGTKRSSGEIEFKNQNRAKAAMEALEPYLIMRELTE